MLKKEDLEHLAGLARINLNKSNPAAAGEKLLKDLEGILNYFEELKKVNTKGVEPMTGGTSLQNEFRDESLAERLDKDPALEQFPEKKDGFLKIPPVF